MKNSLVLFTLFLSLFIVFQSCKKDKKKGCTDPISANYDPMAEENDGTCQYAGIGGATTIVAKPEHHGASIHGQPGYVDSAFVKFNTENFPGTNPALYDLVIAGEEGEDHVQIEHLKPGKYFIMMTGMDTSINERVIGGIPYTLTQPSGQVVVTVPVTE